MNVLTLDHIQQIDRHRPWTVEECALIPSRVKPKYLTHEISGSVYHGKKYAIWRQQRRLHWGQHEGLDKMTVSEAEEYRARIREKPEPTGNCFFDHIVRGIV